MEIKVEWNMLFYKSRSIHKLQLFNFDKSELKIV